MRSTTPHISALRTRPLRVLLLSALVLMVGLVWVSLGVLTERNLSALSLRAQSNTLLAAQQVDTLIQRNATAIELLVANRALINLARKAENDTIAQAEITETLGKLAQQAQSGTIMLVMPDGMILSSDPQIGTFLKRATSRLFAGGFQLRKPLFTSIRDGDGPPRHFFVHRLSRTGPGVAVLLEVNTQSLEQAWAGTAADMFVTTDEDRVLLTSRPDWRGLLLSPEFDPPTRRFQRLVDISQLSFVPLESLQIGSRVRVGGRQFLKLETPLEYQNWTLVHLTPLTALQSRIYQTVLIEILLLTTVLVVAMIFISRRVSLDRLRLERESEELRALNARLSSEVEERLRMQQDLSRAERTLEQSSKLAALGEMSAAISHELNQPLAAMRTYLAGSRLLLERDRPEEALSSFQRIDDLITRMGKITRQLKSFSRMGGEDLIILELQGAVSEALTLMQPQIGKSRADVLINAPEEPILVRADQVRLEQIIINLLRNALDATQDELAPRIEVDLYAGAELCRLRIEDNGPGFRLSPEHLFEPFTTTKGPGEGVGLGLAISASIAEDFGGNLAARLAPSGGAIFELTLPLAHLPPTKDPSK